MRPLALPWITAVSAHIPPRTRHQGQLRQWVLGLCSGGVCEHGPPMGERFRLSAGDVLVIHPGIVQRWSVCGSDPWQVISCVFDPRPHWLPWLALPPVAPGFGRLRLTGTPFRRVQRALMRAGRAARSGHGDAQDRTAHAVEAALLVLEEQRVAQRDHGDARVGRALDLLAEDLGRTLSMAVLCQRCGISPAQLQRLFQRSMGTSPGAYLAQLRYQRASALLRSSDWPVKAVARAVGFGDQRYFSSWFRGRSGETPSALRSRAARSASRPS